MDHCREIWLLGCLADIQAHLAARPDHRLQADFLNLRGTMSDGKRGVGGWTWTRNKRYIFDALHSGHELRLVTDPDQPIPAGGNTYQRELKYLTDLGCRWRRVRDYWVVAKPGGYAKRVVG